MKTNDLATCVVYFDDRSGGKSRPVFIAGVQKNQVIMYKITSQYDKKPEHIKNKYFEIVQWRDAGLNKKSWIDTYSGPKIYKASSIKNVFGELTTSDVIRFHDFLESK